LLSQKLLRSMILLMLGAMNVGYLLAAGSKLSAPSYSGSSQYASIVAQAAEKRSCEEDSLNPEYIGLRDIAANKLKSAPVMTIWASDGQKIHAKLASQGDNSITVAVLGINCVTTSSGGAIRAPRGLLNSRLQTKQSNFLDMGAISTSMDYYGYTLIEYRIKPASGITTGDPIATLRLGTEKLRVLLVERNDRSRDSWGFPTSKTGYTYTGLLSRSLLSGSAAQSLQEGKCIILTNDGGQYRCSYGMNALLPEHLTIRFDAQRLYSVRPLSQKKGAPLLD
jgi:hypothetical protein